MQVAPRLRAHLQGMGRYWQCVENLKIDAPDLTQKPLVQPIVLAHQRDKNAQHSPKTQRCAVVTPSAVFCNLNSQSRIKKSLLKADIPSNAGYLSRFKGISN